MSVFGGFAAKRTQVKSFEVWIKQRVLFWEQFFDRCDIIELS